MPTSTDGAFTCPHCGRPNEVATGSTGTRPKPEDVTLCFGCHLPAIVADDGQHLRLPTQAELAEVLAEPEFQKLLTILNGGAQPLRAADMVWGKH